VAISEFVFPIDNDGMPFRSTFRTAHSDLLLFTSLFASSLLVYHRKGASIHINIGPDPRGNLQLRERMRADIIFGRIALAIRVIIITDLFNEVGWNGSCGSYGNLAATRTGAAAAPAAEAERGGRRSREGYRIVVAKRIRTGLPAIDPGWAASDRAAAIADLADSQGE
jgi:hypothetical protein